MIMPELKFVLAMFFLCIPAFAMHALYTTKKPGEHRARFIAGAVIGAVVASILSGIRLLL